MSKRRTVALLVGLALLPLLAGCVPAALIESVTGDDGIDSPLESPASPDSEAEAVYYLDAEPGLCGVLELDAGNMSTGYLLSLDCTTSHGFEIVDTVDYEGDDYPGDEVLDEFANDTCTSLMADYLGTDDQDSVLWATFWTPYEEEWTESHAIVCGIERWDGAQLWESVRDRGDDYLIPGDPDEHSVTGEQA